MNTVKALAFFMMSLLTAVTSASPSQDQLQQLRVSVTDAMTAFYMYNGLEADVKYAARMDRNIEAAFDALTNITEGGDSDEETAFIRSLLSDWNTFSTLIADNRQDIMTRGYPDIRLVNEMGEACLSMTKEATRLYKMDGRPAEEQVSLPVRLSHDLEFQMADITAQYTGRGTSNLGQVFVGYHTATPKEMAATFEALLNKFEAVVKEEDKRTIRGIRNKWAFLSRSISNYNENSVPFLVLTYNDRIIAELRELTAKYR